ncbi:MAG: fumarylacetoacetate hydrolase family protein [Candidatus Sericytochromatia bacterium]|nr:fumarylacetoacetate hydrolase family protein [Candidatus Tanganyikabacteria bacterium]
MPLHSSHAQAIAETLDSAAREGRLVPMLTSTEPDLTVADAYFIQELSRNLRQDGGDRQVGMKMGLTSLAKMRQMGVHTPIYGFLAESMLAPDGATLDMSRLVQPRIEPEIAFILGADLRGPTTPAQAMLAVSGICAALEVLDSRYEDYRFNLPDVVADNASGAHFVLGSHVAPPGRLDISNLGMVLSINGRIREVGSSAAIFEHPARSLARLATMLAERDRHLEAGQIVLAGGATAAVEIAPGDWVRLEVEGLGTVNVRCGAKEPPVAQPATGQRRPTQEDPADGPGDA